VPDNFQALREIEEQPQVGSCPRQKLMNELDALEGRVKKIAVPLSYTDQLYSLKSHIDLAISIWFARD
jgi:hypothetical protein